MNETEKQNYIRLQTMRLQKLADISYCISQLSSHISINIRAASDYYTKNNCVTSNTDLFKAIDQYKTLLTDFGELK